MPDPLIFVPLCAAPDIHVGLMSAAAASSQLVEFENATLAKGASHIPSLDAKPAPIVSSPSTKTNKPHQYIHIIRATGIPTDKLKSSLD
eukprot:4689321-Pyramimonas_sp.AAC.1